MTVMLGLRLALPLTLLGSAMCDSNPAQVAGASEAAIEVENAASNGNAVLHWNALAAELMVDPGPVMDARAYAILSASVHDAVNGVKRRYEPYTADLSDPDASLDAAIATAAHDVIVALSPSTQERTESEYAAALASIEDGPSKTKGITLGRQAAKANLDRRAGDGIPVGQWPPQSGPVTEPVYVPTGEPGDYAFTPPFDRPPLGPIALFPGLGNGEPFLVDVTKYELHGPDPLSSEDYVRDVERLKSVGSLTSKTRTPDQTETAKFWFEDFQVLNRIANTVIQRNGLDEWDAARAFALMHLAVVDAGIACFRAKYHYRFWRPYTAIRLASEDGNPKTVPDTAWLPLLWTPLDNPQQTFLIPPIPEYPSAAGTVAAAATEVLASIVGNEQRFEATSPFLPGVTRRYTSLRQAAEEAGMSRVYGGIHFLRAVRDGWQLGRSVARDVVPMLPPVR